MIVVDCSAMVEALIGAEPDPALLKAVGDNDLHAPHLLDVEILSVLRGLEHAGKIDTVDAEQTLADYLAMLVVRHRLDAVADRVWALRHNLTAYDAAYVAFAEALDAPLVTCDRKLLPPPAGRSGTPLHDVEVLLFPRS